MPEYKIGALNIYSYLLQILKQNADKKDAEFNERFKHRLFSCHHNTLSSILLLLSATANPPNVVCWTDSVSAGQCSSMNN
jgi:hypothetical protein